MSGSHRRPSKHEARPNALGRKLSLKKTRGKSIVLENRPFKFECDEGKCSYMTNIDHKEEIFAAFYDNLLLSIVSKRETIESEEEASKEICISPYTGNLEESDHLNEDTVISEEEITEAGSKNQSNLMNPFISARTSSLREEPSSMSSKKSEKTSQESVRNVPSAENVLKYEDLPPPKTTIEKIVFKNGNIYEGEVFCNQIKGKGTFYWSDGTVYEGQFKDECPSGRGKMTLPDLSIYEGDFCNGYFHGNGVLRISSSPIQYCGHWKNGKKHGKGWLLYEPGNWYEGYWFEDSKHRMGFRKYKNGCKYKGNWKDNIKKGNGKMMWNNNDFYDGEWSENMQDGYGEYTWSVIFNESLCFPSYNWYRGSWVGGKRTGIGIMNFGAECGSKLGGTWFHDRKHGPGVMMCGNGKTTECNPLFENDRPVHIYSRKCVDDMISEEENIHKPSQENSTKKDSFRDIWTLIRTKVASTKFPDEIIWNITKNGSELEGKNFLKLYDSLSGNKKMWCPLKIPIHSVAEEVNLAYYIEISQDFLIKEPKDMVAVSNFPQKDSHSKTYSKNFESSVYSEKSAHDTPCGSIVYRKEETMKLKEKEIFFLKNQIIINLSKLTKIYNLYASFAKRNTLSFKPVLTRLFLWQLMRDMHISQEGVSLIQIDYILSNNPASCVETDHYPFEPIYFYQYIQSLVGCAWLMFLAEKISSPVTFGGGLVAMIFKKLLEDYVYPNAGNFTGSVLSDNKDLVPITAVYNLYLSLGEPLSVRSFLLATYVKKGIDPPCYYALNSKADMKHRKEGYNAVTVAHEIHYLPANDTTENDDSSIIDESLGNHGDPFYKTLYSLRSLGKKTITHCLTRICPKIMGPNMTIDLSYKLTFLEFYEVLMKCAFLKAEETRKDQEMQLREAQRILIEQKLSVSAITKAKDRSYKKKKSKKSMPTF